MILLQQTDKYRAESETEAKDFIAKISDEQYSNGYKLVENSCKYKNKKMKGEIIDEWYEVIIKKSYEE